MRQLLCAERGDEVERVLSHQGGALVGVGDARELIGQRLGAVGAANARAFAGVALASTNAGAQHRGLRERQAAMSELSVSMELTLPIQLRGGLRYIHTDDEGEEVFDLEIDVFWENWSVIDEYYVQMDGEISAQAVEDIVMPKAWQDTVAVRVGADWRAVPDLLTVRAGGFYETGAVPQNYTHLDFPSFERGGVGLGFTFDVGPVSLSAGYMHVFQEDRNVSELKAKVFAQRPLRPCPENCDGINGVPSNAGSYKTSFDILSFGIDLHWGRFLADDDEDTDHTLEGLPPAEAEPEREPEPEPAPAEPVPPRAEDAGTPDPDTPDPDTPDPDTPDPDTPDADEPTEAPAEEPPGARR